MSRKPISLLMIVAVVLLVLAVYGITYAEGTGDKLGDAQIENIVRLSYKYVAMYNVNNKFAMDPSNPLSTGGGGTELRQIPSSRVIPYAVSPSEQ